MASKPALRNLLLNKTKKDFILALGVSITLATSFYYGVKEQRRKTFQEFWKNYDADKDYERMVKAGVFKGYSE